MKAWRIINAIILLIGWFGPWMRACAGPISNPNLDPSITMEPCFAIGCLFISIPVIVLPGWLTPFAYPGLIYAIAIFIMPIAIAISRKYQVNNRQLLIILVSINVISLFFLGIINYGLALWVILALDTLVIIYAIANRADRAPVQTKKKFLPRYLFLALAFIGLILIFGGDDDLLWGYWVTWVGILSSILFEILDYRSRPQYQSSTLHIIG